MFRNHLHRTYTCRPLVSNVSLDQLKTQYGYVSKNGEYECSNCKKSFTSRSGLTKHKKMCFEVTNNDLKHLVVGKEYTETMNSLLKSVNNIEKLLLDMYTLNLSSTSKPITQQAPCKVKDFGQEEILHLLHNENLMKQIFIQNETGLLKFIDLIWFDENHVKNNNIRIKDKEHAEYYQYEKWNTVKINNIVFTLADYLGCYLQQSLEYSSFLSESFLDSYMEKIGINMEWDLSHGEWEYDGEQESDDLAKRKILQSIKLHLLKKI